MYDVASIVDFGRRGVDRIREANLRSLLFNKCQETSEARARRVANNSRVCRGTTSPSIRGIPEVQTVVSLMRGQSAAWTDRRIRPTVHERNITAGQFVPFDVCHAFLARRSTSRRHCHHFAHIRVEYEHRLG